MEEFPFTKQFENALGAYNRKVWKGIGERSKETLKLMLANGTEMLFRSDIGQRRLFGGSVIGGALWVITAIVTLVTGLFLPSWYVIIGFLASLGVFIICIRLCGGECKATAGISKEKNSLSFKESRQRALE